MKHFSVGFVAVMLLAAARPAAAQSPVSITFENGYVTLVARNAPVRTILAEWARVGGSKIVNADRVAGTPLTLEINHEPERKALAILLRNVSGYVAASRDVTSSGRSSLDRIHILPTPPPVQTPVPFTAAAPVRQTTPTPTARVSFFPGDANDDGADDNVIVGAGAPARREPPVQQAMPPAAPLGGFGGPTATVSMPTVTRPGDDQPDRTTAPPTTPSFPGAFGTGRPGEITPVNQQPRTPEDTRSR